MPLQAASLTVGRDKSADLYLDNRALSRKHAKLEKKGAAIWVADLGSQNGTFVNGERIREPRALKGGDIIEVGRYQLHIDGVEEAAANTPVITLTGPEGRHRFAMVDREIIIGRAPSCDIAIGHKSISRRHVCISVDNNQFFCEDLGSQNGTRINGKRINGRTGFSVGDKIRMSDFTIEVGFLEEQTAERANKTMMIDRSELAKAAYVDGDVDRMRSSAGRLALGRKDSGTVGNDLDEYDLSEDSATRGLPNYDPGRDLPPAPAMTARLAVLHPDHGEREIPLTETVTLVGEDGSNEDKSRGMMFADQAYLLFSRTADGIVVAVIGDRRVANVNGQSMLCKVLADGDTVELGALTAIFHG